MTCAHKGFAAFLRAPKRVNVTRCGAALASSRRGDDMEWITWRLRSTTLRAAKHTVITRRT